MNDTRCSITIFILNIIPAELLPNTQNCTSYCITATSAIYTAVALNVFLSRILLHPTNLHNEEIVSTCSNKQENQLSKQNVLLPPMVIRQIRGKKTLTSVDSRPKIQCTMHTARTPQKAGGRKNLMVIVGLTISHAAKRRT